MAKTVTTLGGKVTPRLSLSALEYAALSAIPAEGSRVSAVDLAVAAQLTGSQVREAIDLLTTRGLVEGSSEASVRLSDEGDAVRRRLARQVLVIDLSDDSSPAVVATEKDVDAALEKALARLQA